MAGIGRISIGGLSSGMDTDNMIKELMAVQRLKSDRLKKKNISMDYRQEEWKKMNAKIYSFYNKELTAVRLKTNFIKHKVSSSNASVADATTDPSALKGTHELEVLSLAKTASTASGHLQTTSGDPISKTTTMQDMGLAGKTLEISYMENGTAKTVTVTAEATDTLAKFADKVRSLTKDNIALEANVDIKNSRMFLATKNSGEKNSFTLSGDIATAFGFTTNEVKGVDAKYRYNGLDFTSDTNQIEVNGLKATLKSVGSTTISVEKDTDAAYKQVIDFFKAYNVLVKDMQDKIGVTIPRNQRDMEPLMDEEKKGMSEADVKKWEETLRERVFKNDTNLKGLLADMRSVFATTSIEGNGKYTALSSLGIGTGEYNQGTGALLFVDGDSELGAKRSDLSNKLKTALEEDPEAVAELLNKLGEELHKRMSEKMKSTSLRSYMSFYDDKAVKEEQKQLSDRIRQMEIRLEAMEDRYRKQFMAMEKALAKSNSTSSWLSQQLGSMR